MKQIFKLTSSKLEGAIQVTYFKEYLNVVEIGFKNPMSEFQFDHLVRLLPYKLDLDKFRMLGFGIEEIYELPTNKKIALFCSKYEGHYGIKYRASRSDGGKISKIKISIEIIDHYFNSQNFLFKGKHSVSNLVRYYNELLAEIAVKFKPKHPDSWNKEYEQKLSQDSLKEYWTHLRSKGLKPVKNRLGITTAWE